MAISSVPLSNYDQCLGLKFPSNNEETVDFKYCFIDTENTKNEINDWNMLSEIAKNTGFNFILLLF